MAQRNLSTKQAHIENRLVVEGRMETIIYKMDKQQGSTV